MKDNRIKSGILKKARQQLYKKFMPLKKLLQGLRILLKTTRGSKVLLFDNLANKPGWKYSKIVN